MSFTLFKFFLSAAVITGASEIAKRSTTFAALLISVPLISILSFMWVYVESKDTERIADLSINTLLWGIPSMAFFAALSGAIRYGMNFWLSLAVALVITVLAYLIYWKLLATFGIEL